MTINIPAIIATDIHKKYGLKTTLNWVIFTVGKGPIFDLLRPNDVRKIMTIGTETERITFPED
jgi:ABC-type lipopolysaccharide export system ATPase subunit